MKRMNWSLDKLEAEFETLGTVDTIFPHMCKKLEKKIEEYYKTQEAKLRDLPIEADVRMYILDDAGYAMNCLVAIDDEHDVMRFCALVDGRSDDDTASEILTALCDDLDMSMAPYVSIPLEQAKNAMKEFILSLVA